MSDSEAKLHLSGYRPLPATELKPEISAALKVLANPDIPLTHEEGNFNCGECWDCIMGTLMLVDIFRKEAKRKVI